MKRWMGVLLWTVGACHAGIEIQHWTAAYRMSIWDSPYQRGVGGTGGVETHLFANTTGVMQLGYSYFGSRYADNEFPTVHEWELLFGFKHEFHPSEDNFVYPRLGAHLGTSRNWMDKWHFIGGVDAEGVVPVSKSWSINLGFQPSYSVGALNRFFWRVSLGVMLDAKP